MHPTIFRALLGAELGAATTPRSHHGLAVGGARRVDRLHLLRRMGGRPARESWALETSPRRRPSSRCTPPTASSGRRPPATDTSASSSSASSARRPASPPRSTGKGPPGAADGANDRTLEAYAKAGYPEQMSRVRRAPRAPPPEDPRAQIMLEHGINYLWIGGWALLAAVFAVARRAAPRSPLNSHPFTATRLVPGADVLAPGPAALPLPVGLLLRHRLRERRARRAPARNVRRLARARALPGDRVLAEQRDRPSQAWAARGRARAGRRGRRAAPQATTGASSSPSSSPRRSSRRPSSSTGATTSTASSSRPRSSSPWASSGAASRSRHPDRREGRRPAPAPARRPRPPRAGDEALPTPHVLSARPRRARDLDPRPSG